MFKIGDIVQIVDKKFHEVLRHKPCLIIDVDYDVVTMFNIEHQSGSFKHGTTWIYENEIKLYKPNLKHINYKFLTD